MEPIADGLTNVTRRTALGLLGAAATLPLAAHAASAADAPAKPTAGSQPGAASASPATRRIAHAPKPLSFDPAALEGFSRDLLLSHHRSNYGGAVRRLIAIEERIAGLPRDAQPFELGALKREALVARNSMRLHELYFDNLGGGGLADGPFAALARRRFGSLDAWEHDFRLTGLSLAGGSGWVIATYDPVLDDLQNVWASDHTQGLAGGLPLLVMDMYEHAYHMDYGPNARGYVDAFLANLRTSEVDRRLEAALGGLAPTKRG